MDRMGPKKSADSSRIGSIRRTTVEIIASKNINKADSLREEYEKRKMPLYHMVMASRGQRGRGESARLRLVQP